MCAGAIPTQRPLRCSRRHFALHPLKKQTLYLRFVYRLYSAFLKAIMACQSCFNTLLSFSDLCYRERDLISFLQDHLVLPGPIACPRCEKDCYLAREDTRLRFRCQRQVKVPKTRKTKKCSFSVTAKKGTFFEGCHLDVPTVCRFVACWLLVHHPKKRFIMEELQVSSRTFVDWSSFCREITRALVGGSTRALGRSWMKLFYATERQSGSSTTMGHYLLEKSCWRYLTV
uniref:Uncharacterized protein n=1 Tax=Photinus pyralis TaxID=7054 RepID=A0A1Y1MZV5_PHOPY